MCFSWELSYGKREPETIRNIFKFGPPVDEKGLFSKQMTEQQIFPTFHSHAQDTKSMHHSFICLNTQLFTSILRALWCGPQRNSSPSGGWQPKASAARRSPRRLECRCPTKLRLQRLRSGDEVVPRSVGRPCGAEARLCLVFLCSLPTSPELCVVCGSRVDPVIKTPCCTVASVRQRLQAAGIERSMTTVRMLMKADHKPAKQETCARVVVFFFTFLFCGPR